MNSNRLRLAQSAAVSLALLAVVLWLADVGSIDLSAVQPLLLIPTVAAYTIALVLRGASLQILAEGGTGLHSGRWIALAARHQLVFVLAPSGTGDIAFPVLARQLTGLGLGDGARLIAQTRVRDLCVLCGLGCAGLAGTGDAPPVILAGTAIAAVALYHADLAIPIVTAAWRFLRRRPVEGATVPVRRFRLVVAVVPVLLWLTAGTAISTGFGAAGHPLGLYESWIMLAGLNVAGALALSIGGFGVAEAGATGVLMLLGVMPLSRAAAIAMIARPLLLMSNTGACAIVGLAVRLASKRSQPR